MGSFDVWNEVKKRIDSEEELPNRFPKEGEVWMSALGKNIGYEQNGAGDHFSRPILIVKKFNNHMFWSVPLTSKQKKFDFYYNFTDFNGNRVSAILAQLKLMSVKRLKRKLHDFPFREFLEVKEKLKTFL